MDAPCGMFLFNTDNGEVKEDYVTVSIGMAIGDVVATKKIGTAFEIPSCLMKEKKVTITQSRELVRAIPCHDEKYNMILCLPVPGAGMILLLAPDLKDRDLSLDQMLLPMLANLGKTALLCRLNDEHVSMLEQSVQERTVKLERANAKLKVEIFEREQVEIALRSSEAEFRGIFENLQDVFYRTDNNGQIVKISPSVAAVFHVEPEIALGQRLSDLYVDKEGRQQFLHALDQSGGEITGYELEARRPDGQIIWVSSSAHYYYDANGEISGVEGILRDITAKKESQKLLNIKTEKSLQLLAENRHLSKELMKVQESERRYLARELHDELGQSLTAISTMAELISRKTENHVVAEYVDEIASIIDNVFLKIRGMLRKLRPPMLDTIGFIAAIEDLLHKNTYRSGNSIKFSLSTSGDLKDLPDIVNVSAYRIIQESCTNAFKHSNAAHVDVCLCRRLLGNEAESNGEILELDIRDDGRGLDLNDQNIMGMGMVGMRERVKSLGGTCSVNTVSEKGVHVAIVIPITKNY